MCLTTDPKGAGEDEVELAGAEAGPFRGPRWGGRPNQDLSVLRFVVPTARLISCRAGAAEAFRLRAHTAEIQVVLWPKTVDKNRSQSWCPCCAMRCHPGRRAHTLSCWWYSAKIGNPSAPHQAVPH